MTGIDSQITPMDQALLPASVRSGTKERRAEYQAALSFERSLVSQMTESMMKTASIGGDDEDAPAAVKAMKDQLPSNMADAIMGAGGLGLASQLDKSWHPEAYQLHTSLSGDAAKTGGTAA